MAPKKFLIANEKTRSELYHFFQLLRSAVVAGVNKIHVNFRNTTEMHSCGTLLLVAEFDRLSRIKPKMKISCSYPKNNKVEKVLQQIGFFSLLNKEERCEITAQDKDVINWRYCTATDANTESLIGLMEEINSIISSTAGKKLGTGISEALTNCAQHAYEDARYDGLERYFERRWWMFAEVIDDVLVVAFCDLGIGIPRSLQANWGEILTSHLMLQYGAKHEGRMIEASFAIGRTRTGQQKHGKGMNDLKRVIDITKSGYLTVYSNHGRFSYSYRDGVCMKDTTGYKTSIYGTLIQWSIPVSEVAHLA